MASSLAGAAPRARQLALILVADRLQPSLKTASLKTASLRDRPSGQVCLDLAREVFLAGLIRVI